MAEPLAVLGTYRRLAGAAVRSRLQYRLSFALDFVSAGGVSFLEFVAVLVIFSHLRALGGWSLYEVAFLYGAAGVAFAITDVAVGHIDLFAESIRRGDFDVVLLRPLGTLFQVIAADFAIRRLAKVAQAAAVLAFAIAHLRIDWTPVRLALLAAMLVSGTAIFSGIWVAGASVAFWILDGLELLNSFTYGGSFLSAYPVSIFGEWVRRLFAFVVPVAFVAYYPSLYILGRRDPLGGPTWLSFASPLVALLVLAAAGWAWRTGVRHYRSAGS